MSENLQNLLRESLLNNSYDYNSMHNVLRMVWENSYSYLYDLQKKYIEFEDLEYESTIGMLYNDKLLRVCFNINYDFIHACDREEFHNSDFYFNEFTFYDIINNYKIFKKIPIIMIDNQCIWDYKLSINKNNVTIILPFKRDFIIEHERDLETDELVYIDHNIRVLIVDNIYYHEFKSIAADNETFDSDSNSLYYNFNSFAKSYTSNIDNITISLKTKRNLTINVTDILNNNNLKPTDGLFFATINRNDKNKKNLRDFYSSGILISSNIDYNEQTGEYTCKFQIGDELYNNLCDHNINYMIHIIYINKLNNYMLPVSRHKHSVSCNWYSNIDGVDPYDVYSKLYHETSSSEEIMTKDIVCDENGECNLFILQNDDVPYAMPIPIEHLIVVKFDQHDNPTLLINRKSVKLYYPNIYKIIDPNRTPGDRYQISYFYHNATFLEYTPLYDYFYRFLQIHYNERPIEEIIDFIYRGVADLSSFTNEQNDELKSTFKKIMEYNYYNHQYGEIDFIKRYVIEPSNSDKKAIEYKDETLKSWIANDPYILRDYVIEQNKLYNPIYHLWTNTLDLSSRLRTDTTQELESYGYNLFDNYYVFSFRNDETVKNNILDARVFVDGLHVDNIIQERYKFTDYFYIPESLVTNDSYIEIEIFPSYKYEKYVKFNSLDSKETITLLEPADQIFPTAQDLFYMEPAGNLISGDYNMKTSSKDALGNKNVVEFSTKQSITISNNGDYLNTNIYSNKFFEITAKYDDGDFIVKTTNRDKPVKFTRLSKFEIKPLYDDVLNKDLYIGISKVPNYINYTIDTEGYPYIALKENNFKFNVEYLRIFKNGRLLPRQKYCFFASFFFPRIQFTDYMYPGDTIHIDITPYRYKEIYYQKDLEQGKTLIDLKNVITKPFDIRYYDVYMNGRKLGLNSVWTISPWEITLTNLKSLHNLQIFEKERDWEYFGTNYNEVNYYYTIDDLFNSSFITENEKNQIIKEMIEEAKEPECNIKPPEDLEPPMDFTDERIYPHITQFYFNELIPKTFVNPDTKQFDDDVMQQDYTTIDNMYRVHPIDSYRTKNEKERRSNYVDVLSLNPDLYLEGQNSEQLQYIYCVGHIDDVTNEILSETSDNYYKEEGIDNAN